MKVLFTGLPYFGKRLVAELSKFDRKNRYIFCNTYYSRLDQLKFLFHLNQADIVVSFNGASSQSGSLDRVLKKNKKLIMQWHGSDVLKLRENIDKNTVEWKYIQAAKSFTDSTNLKDELAELGVQAELLQFKHTKVSQSNEPFSDAGVVTYIAQGKEKFYGLDKIEFLAKKFPQVAFHVIGSEGNSNHKFPNLIFHGWVDARTFSDLLNRHAIFIRMTEHDGNSLSVMEALANGNYVIWNNKHACTEFASSELELEQKFKEVSEEIARQSFRRSASNRAWISANHQPEGVLTNYIKSLGL